MYTWDSKLILPVAVENKVYVHRLNMLLYIVVNMSPHETRIKIQYYSS